MRSFAAYILLLSLYTSFAYSLPTLPVEPISNPSANQFTQSGQVNQNMAVLHLPAINTLPDEQISAPVSMTLSNNQVYSVDLTVHFDPTVISAVGVVKGSHIPSWSIAANYNTPGVIRVALAGATPISSGGEMALLLFEPVGSAGSESPLVFVNGELNEGSVPVTLEDGQVTIVSQVTHFLEPGWNLVGLTLVSDPPTTASLALSQIEAQAGYATEINRWHNGGWNAHVMGFPFNNFTLTMGQGYFVRAAASSEWQRTGIPPHTPIEIALSPGWNLIGLPLAPEGITASTLLNDIAAQGGNCTEINRWHNGGWNAHIMGFPFNNFVVEAHRGYFVRCLQSSVYVPNGTGILDNVTGQ